MDPDAPEDDEENDVDDADGDQEDAELLQVAKGGSFSSTANSSLSGHFRIIIHMHNLLKTQA